MDFWPAGRIVLIFLVAILLPALVVGYLSLQRVLQEAGGGPEAPRIEPLVSGESTLRAVEAALLEREKEGAAGGEFRPSARFWRAEGCGTTGCRSARQPASRRFPGTPFLLDGEYSIVFPRTGSERPPRSIRRGDRLGERVFQDPSDERKPMSIPGRTSSGRPRPTGNPSPARRQTGRRRWPWRRWAAA